MCFAPGLVKNTLGPSGIRTRDLPITSRMLYQLSYRPLDCQTAEMFLSTQLPRWLRWSSSIRLVIGFSYGSQLITLGPNGACDHFHITMADPKCQHLLWIDGIFSVFELRLSISIISFPTSLPRGDLLLS